MIRFFCDHVVSTTSINQTKRKRQAEHLPKAVPSCVLSLLRLGLFPSLQRMHEHETNIDLIIRLSEGKQVHFPKWVFLLDSRIYCRVPCEGNQCCFFLCCGCCCGQKRQVISIRDGLLWKSETARASANLPLGFKVVMSRNNA